MPRAPSTLRIHPKVSGDIAAIKKHNPDHAKRIWDSINDWDRMISWGRVPQDKMTYLTTNAGYNFYREWVGRSGYRVIYEISNDVMTVVAALPKDDDTYDLDEITRRMSQI